MHSISGNGHVTFLSMFEDRRPFDPRATEALNALFCSSLAPIEIPMRDALVAEVRSVATANKEKLEEGFVVALPSRDFIRPGIVLDADLKIDPDLYLFENRHAGIPLTQSGFPEPMDQSHLCLVKLSAALALVESDVAEAISTCKEVLARGEFVQLRPSVECGIEVCALLNERLGADYSLGESMAPSDGAPLYYTVHAVFDQTERANRIGAFPMKSAWREAKKLN